MAMLARRSRVFLQRLVNSLPTLRALLTAPPRVFASAYLSFALLLGLLVVGNLLIFEDFILGDRLLLFDDLGSDSIFHNLPVMHCFANLRPFGQYWLHGSALGNNVFMFPWVNVFNPILKVLGWNATVPQLAHRIVYYAVIQSLLAGVFLYWFLLRSGRSTFAAIAASLSYALCGAFTAVSTWMVILTPPLLAGLAIVLWAYRVWQQERRWYVLTLATSYFAVSTQPLVTLYQLAVFLLLYLFAEAVASPEPRARRALPGFLRQVATTALVAGVGLLAVAFFLIPHAYYTLFHTARPATVTIHPLALPAAPELLAVFLRTYSNDLLGTANLWTARYGFSNYMELPFLYCGVLLLLVLAAHCFQRGRLRLRREQIAAAVLLLPLTLAQFLPGVRAYLFFGGRAAYFRWTSVFMVAALAITGSGALDRFAVRPKPRKTRLMVVGSAALLLIGALALVDVTAVVTRHLPVDRVVSLAVAVTILGDALLLQIPQRAIKYYGVLLLLLAELTFQGHRTVSFQRSPLPKAEGGRAGGVSQVYSNPSMLKAIALVKRVEAGSFFRVSKTPEYTDLVDNSSLCQGYYGTRGYTAFNNPATVAFYEGNHVALGRMNSYLPGFRERYLLDALVGVKYYLRRGTLPVPPWAVRLASVGHTDVYWNPRAFPLGVLYDRYMSEAEFRRLPLGDEERDLLLLSVAVVGEEALTRKRSGWVSLAHVTGPVVLSSRDDVVRDATQERQRNGLKVVSLERDAIAARIAGDRAGLVFFSIPYDAGWHIRVDGMEVDRLRVQIGFLGALVPAGEHAIRLEYRPPYYRLGVAVSVTGVVGIIVTLIFLRREAAEFLSITERTGGRFGSGRRFPKRPAGP